MWVYTYKLASWEWSHLNLLACNCVCRKLSCCIVLAPCCLSVCRSPCSVNCCTDRTLSDCCCLCRIIHIYKCASLKEIKNCLSYVCTACLIPSTCICKSVIVKCKVKTCTLEEWVYIPGIWYVHSNLLICLLCCLDHSIQWLNIILCEYWWIIEHEVSVICCHWICI